jgi:HAD superfamily phosphatase (TIGR01668 family)
MPIARYTRYLFCIDHFFCDIVGAKKKPNSGVDSLLHNFIPDLYAKSIYAIDLDELQNRGIKGIIVDLDNTLVESQCCEATPLLIDWLNKVKQKDFRVMIVSNNNKARVSKFARPLDIPFIYGAKKPLSSAFHKALSLLGTHRYETAMVGDQLLTDVFGGNRVGLFTILVLPVSNTEGVFTRINRRLERVVFHWLKKRGLFGWEEGN